MMSIKCLKLHLEPHFRVAWTHNAAPLRYTVMNFFHRRCLSLRRFWREKPIYFSFLLQLDYNNSHSSCLSFKFSLHVISNQLASCLNRMAL